MKSFHYAGLAAALLIIGAGFLPWLYIAPIQQTYTGMDTGQSNFGKPAVLSIFFAVFFLAFTLIPRGWAKRVNLFVGAAVVAWNLRNYLILSHCELGYCPDKKIGLYLSLLLAIVMLVAACVPYLPGEKNHSS